MTRVESPESRVEGQRAAAPAYCQFEPAGGPDTYRCRVCGDVIRTPNPSIVSVCKPRPAKRCGTGEPAAIGPCALDCRWIGPLVGERGRCGGCKGSVIVKEYACSHPRHARSPVTVLGAACGDYEKKEGLGTRDQGSGSKSGDKSPHSKKRKRVLLVMRHGLGDSVQLTTVLLHLRALRADWDVDVSTFAGHASLFRGLCSRVFADGEPVGGPYDRVEHLAWHEPHGVYWDSPSTKAEKCLREVFQITPVPELCRYQIEPSEAHRARAAESAAEIKEIATRAGRPCHGFVLIHYQGHMSPGFKNINEQAIAAVCRKVLQLGHVPVILEWERRSGLRGLEGVVFGDRVPGDGGAIAALAERAALCVGIDSGPGHIFAALKTPTLIVPGRMPVIHYFPPAAHCRFVVNANWAKHVRGDLGVAVDYFARHYRHHVLERNIVDELPWLVEEGLRSQESGGHPVIRVGSQESGEERSRTTTSEPSIFLSGGIGDVLAIESHLAEGERAALATGSLWYATNKRAAVEELLRALWPGASHGVAWDDFPEGFWCFTAKEQCLRKLLASGWPAGLAVAEDFSIDCVFPQILRGERFEFTGSSFLRQKCADLSNFAERHGGRSLPERYVVICPYSSDKRQAGRDFDAEDWEACLAILKREKCAGVVLNQGADEMPDRLKAELRTIDLSNQTTLLEAIEILKGASGYVGIDSALSVLAAQLFGTERHGPGVPGAPRSLQIKCRNEHALRNAAVYFAPHQSFEFLVPAIRDER